MIRFFVLTVLSVCPLFSVYSVGDQVSVEDQNMEFNFCYPESKAGTAFKFADLNGALNGGVFKIIMIEMSASW